jgi:hypothetical protein
MSNEENPLSDGNPVISAFSTGEFSYFTFWLRSHTTQGVLWKITFPWYGRVNFFYHQMAMTMELKNSILVHLLELSSCVGIFVIIHEVFELLFIWLFGYFSYYINVTIYINEGLY